MFVQMRRSLTGPAAGCSPRSSSCWPSPASAPSSQNVTWPATSDAYRGSRRRPTRSATTGCTWTAAATAAPTVVLFNGLGEISASWARITARSAHTTRVCAYDRAGQGWSDDVAEPAGRRAAAADLHVLLDAAGEQGPFVLVGHSIGGPYAMTYAAQYPDQVAGMVLLDSSSPRQLTDIPSYAGPVRRHATRLRPAAHVSRAGTGATGRRRLPPPAHVGRPGRAMTSTLRAARNARDEMTIVPEVFEQAQALTTLGDRPLVVLTASENLDDARAGRPPRTSSPAVDQPAHRDVDSTHQGLVETTPAAESVRAITEVVFAVRTGTPLD